MNRFAKLFTSAQRIPCGRDRIASIPLRVERHMDGWLGVVIMIVLGMGFAATMIGASLLLGPKNPTPEKLAPYECGMPAVGDARERHSVQFYLVAMIFLLFDIEIAFSIPGRWRSAASDGSASSRSSRSSEFCSSATSTCGGRACSTGARRFAARVIRPSGK
jgi:NADH:ubiquinone oxidoreductase subunit 3 (subunit A)